MPSHLGGHTQAAALFAEHFCDLALVGVRVLCSENCFSLMFVTCSFICPKRKLLQFDGEFLGIGQALIKRMNALNTRLFKKNRDGLTGFSSMLCFRGEIRLPFNQ